jgi:hypothetical protein
LSDIGNNPPEKEESSTRSLFITLTPLEPYFFGTDRTLRFDQGSKEGRSTGRRDGGYFVRSAKWPSQTTLFGALRYLGLNNPNSSYILDDENKGRVGCKSFEVTATLQSFGMIKGISPLYLVERALESGKPKLYVRAPLNHRVGMGTCSPTEPDDLYMEKYTPFGTGADSEEFARYETDGGARCLPVDFDVKTGLVNGWMRLDDRMVVSDSDIFRSVTSVHNNKNYPAVNAQGKVTSEDGFFKKEHFLLNDGYSFAFFALVDSSFVLEESEEQHEDGLCRVSLGSDIVMLGQGKSVFTVGAFAGLSEDSLKVDSQLNTILGNSIVYAQSDIYLNPSSSENSDVVKELYSTCCFVASETRTIRSFTTNYGTSLNRHSIGSLTRLIAAGSVFMPQNVEAFAKFFSNPQPKIAGFNRLAGYPLTATTANQKTESEE